MPSPDKPADTDRVRLHKFMAECGVASRRACEKIIQEGRVTVDGVVVRELGVSVDPKRQRVEVDGIAIRPAAFRYLIYNKPRGVLSALADPRGRGTLADVLPPDAGRLFHVGRLDQDSEGLLLLTNDGELAARLMHPRYQIEKIYRVTCQGDLDAAAMTRMQEGIVDDGERLRAKSVEFIDAGLYNIVLTEGKKREVRRLFAACGCPVRRLVRMAVGPLKLGSLSTGRFREVSEAELTALRRITSG